MRKKLFFLAVVVFSMAIATSGAFAKGGTTTIIDIDTIFMVGSDGSTTQQDTFAWDATPWLYFEIPTGAYSSGVQGKSWWFNPDGIDQGKVQYDYANNTVQIWQVFALGDGTTWDDVKAEGLWNVDAKYRTTDGMNKVEGEGNTGFTLAAAGAPIVPEPVSSILFLAGGATLGVRRYWKKRKNA